MLCMPDGVVKTDVAKISTVLSAIWARLDDDLQTVFICTSR